MNASCSDKPAPVVVEVVLNPVEVRVAVIVHIREVEVAIRVHPLGNVSNAIRATIPRNTLGIESGLGHRNPQASDTK